jgi:hypothetical protein
MLTILSTGKTTVARLFAQCLASMGVVPGTEFKELTAARLMNGGTRFCEQIIQGVLNAGGGAIFIDEAYQLASAQSPGGRQVLDFLLPEVENHTGKILFILAGYDKEMEDLFAHNEGFRSRFPHELRFMDYEDHELRKILEHQVRARYKNSSVPMELEDGMDGLYARIIARRIGYGRGRPGFGNARAVANQVAIIFERQANRLKAERRAGQKSNDFFVSKEDLIGPEPSVALSSNKSWQTLCDLTGLKTVKDSVVLCCRPCKPITIMSSKSARSSHLTSTRSLWVLRVQGKPQSPSSTVRSSLILDSLPTARWSSKTRRTLSEVLWVSRKS